VFNFNIGALPPYDKHLDRLVSTGQIALGGLDTSSPGGMYDPIQKTSYYASIFSFHAGKKTNYTGEPMSTVFVPVLDSFEDDRKTVAMIFSSIQWRSYFDGILTESQKSVDVVLSNTCEGDFTYHIRGDAAVFAGKGNLADPKYEDMAETVDLDLDKNKVVIEPNTVKLTLNQDLCRYSLRIYPTKEGEDFYRTILPIATTLTVAAIFVMTTQVFYVYDVMVERRQQVVLYTAQRSTAIVSSLFPKKVRDQMLQAPVQGNATKLRSLAASKSLSEDNHGVFDRSDTSRAIADLFPHCTGKFTWKLCLNGLVSSESESNSLLFTPLLLPLLLLSSHVCRCREFHSLVVSSRTISGLCAP